MTPDALSYQLDPALFEGRARRRIYRRFAWIGLFVAVLVTGQYLYQPANDSSLIAIPLVMALVGFALFRSLKTQLQSGRRSWESYQLTVADDRLRRVIVNLPAMELRRSEVTRITEAAAEGLTVATADRHRFIFVPEALVGYAEVRERLAAWRSFESPQRARRLGLEIGTSILLIGSLIATGAIPDIRLAMVAGAVLLAVGGFSIWEISQSRVFEKKVKAATIRMFAFMMLAPFARLILHFFYEQPR